MKTDKKTTLLITLFPAANSVVNDVAVLAAKSNGDNEAIGLDELKAYFEVEKGRYSNTCAGMDCFISPDQYLFIRKKTSKGFERVCLIEQVQIMGGHPRSKFTEQDIEQLFSTV